MDTDTDMDAARDQTPAATSDMIAAITAMGFERDKAERAASHFDNMAEALDWILSGANESVLEARMSGSTPVLYLPRDLGEANETNPHADVDTTTEVNEMNEMNESIATASPPTSTSATTLPPMTSSRHTPANREADDDYARRQADAAQERARRERQQARVERARILKEIAADRERKRTISPVASAEVVKASSVSVSVSVSSASASAPVPVPEPVSTSDEVIIQIRQSHGQARRHTFSTSSPVSDVFEYARLMEEPNVQFHLLLPFPRREFQLARDGPMTLREAGLGPRAALSVVLATGGEGTTTTAREDPMEVEIDNVAETGTAEVTHPDESDSAVEARAHPDEQDNVAEARARRAATLAAFESRQQQQQVDIEEAATTPTTSQLLPANRAAIADAIQRRIRRVTTSEAERSSAFASTKRARTVTQLGTPVRHLRDLCLDVTADCLTDPRTNPRHFRYMTHAVGEQLLAALKDKMKLDKVTIKAFINCPLSQVELDNYLLASDGLVALLCAHHRASVDCLSLRGCTSLTDKCMESVKDLRLLTVLDLSFCRITDQAVPNICSLADLTVLKLADTKVTAKSLPLIVKCLPGLSSIDLSKCNLSGDYNVLITVLQLRDLTSLAMESAVLDVPQTAASVSSLSPRLAHLNVGNTSIGDHELTTIVSRLVDLQELIMHNCRQCSIAGVRSVARACKKLRVMSLPVKGLDMDVLLDDMKDLPLAALDLEGQQLTDIGLHIIGGYMGQSLSKLSLQQTQITDEGMVAMRGLSYLVELHLDRTNIGDEGVKYLADLRSLEALSLGETQITNEALVFLHNSMAKFRSTLRELNLARTGVTEDGMQFLRGYTSLQLLNLTACTVDRMKAERWLRDLPAIKSVRYPIVDVTPTARPRRGFGPMDQDGGDQWDDDEE